MLSSLAFLRLLQTLKFSKGVARPTVHSQCIT